MKNVKLYQGKLRDVRELAIRLNEVWGEFFEHQIIPPFEFVRDDKSKMLTELRPSGSETYSEWGYLKVMTIEEKQSSSKPLKDQSYHQKRIADSLETLVGGEGIDVKIGSKEIQSLKDWPSEGEFYNLSEEDVRRIVKEEMEEEPKVYYDEKPCGAPNGSISIDTNKDVVDVWVKKWTKV